MAIIENGGTVTTNIGEAIDVATDNVISTATLIDVKGDADLLLKGTTIENSYATASAPLISLNGEGKNDVTVTDSTIRKIASQVKYAVLATNSKGEDTVVFDGKTKIYDNISVDVGGLMVAVNGSTMTYGGETEFYNNIGLDWNGIFNGSFCNP